MLRKETNRDNLHQNLYTMTLLHNLFLKILFCTMDHTRLEEMQAHDYKNAPSKMISAHNVSPS